MGCLWIFWHLKCSAWCYLIYWLYGVILPKGSMGRSVWSKFYHNLIPSLRSLRVKKSPLGFIKVSELLQDPSSGLKFNQIKKIYIYIFQPPFFVRGSVTSLPSLDGRGFLQLTGWWNINFAHISEYLWIHQSFLFSLTRFFISFLFLWLVNL